MAKTRQVLLKDIAANFGMSIKEFATSMGYSRQALYKAACGMIRLDRRRLAVAQYKLDVISEKMLEAEKAIAEENFKKRSKLIEDLMERLSG